LQSTRYLLFIEMMENLSSTAGLLTPRGRGAVATIRFWGDCRLIDQAATVRFRAANGKPLQEQPLDRVVYGHWGDEIAEQVVVCRVDLQFVEIHCHGGDAAAQRILDDLDALGCTILSWQEMTTQRLGVFESECTEVLTRAGTLRTAHILLEQQSGVLRAALDDLLLASPKKRERIKHKLDELLRWANFGLHLTQAWNVVLAGRPNVGKSSLINALVGYSRSIVFDKPGTTRDVVTAETALDGWPVQLADTAGIREHADPLESAGIDRAQKQLAAADCRVLLFDTSQPPHEDDRRLHVNWPDAIFIAHKCDLPDVWGREVPENALRVSSVTGEGIGNLEKALINRLVPEVPAANTPVPVTLRQIALLTAANEAVQKQDDHAFRNALESILS